MIVLVADVAADNWFDAEDVKESCRNHFSAKMLRLAFSRKSVTTRPIGGQGGEALVLLTESILLALVGGGLGLLLAQSGTVAALAAAPRAIPRVEEVGLDFRVLLFTFSAAVLAGTIFGLAPALKLRNTNLSAR